MGNQSCHQSALDLIKEVSCFETKNEQISPKISEPESNNCNGILKSIMILMNQVEDRQLNFHLNKSEKDNDSSILVGLSNLFDKFLFVYGNLTLQNNLLKQNYKKLLEKFEDQEENKKVILDLKAEIDRISSRQDKQDKQNDQNNQKINKYRNKIKNLKILQEEQQHQLIDQDWQIGELEHQVEVLTNSFRCLDEEIGNINDAIEENDDSLDANSPKSESNPAINNVFKFNPDDYDMPIVESVNNLPVNTNLVIIDSTINTFAVNTPVVSNGIVNNLNHVLNDLMVRDEFYYLRVFMTNQCQFKRNDSNFFTTKSFFCQKFYNFLIEVGRSELITKYSDTKINSFMMHHGGDYGIEVVRKRLNAPRQYCYV